jgi:hypothetical protein
MAGSPVDLFDGWRYGVDMSEKRIVVTDHDFADLSIERANLDDFATVVDPAGDRANGADYRDALTGRTQC